MILVTTHENADFDSCAGVLAAQLLHPGAVASFPGAKETALRAYLKDEPDLVREVRVRDIDLARVDTLVLVDTVSADRIGRFRDLLAPPGRVRIICYDHHVAGAAPAGAEIHIRAVGAVTTLMVSLLRERGIVLGTAQATLMTLGIYEDTGGLMYAGTAPEDLEAVAWLLEQGADLSRVARILARGLTPEQVDLYHALLHEAQTYRFQGREVVVAAASADHFVPDASVVVQQYAQASGASRLVALMRMDDRIVLIVRSRSDDLDASQLAVAFGGGGHASAASAVVRGKTLIETRDRVLSILRQAMTPPLRAGDVATRVLYTVDAESSVSDALRLLNRYRVNALPVVARGRVTGALTRQVADVALHHGMSGRRVKDLVVEEVEVVPVDTDVDDVRRRLLEGGMRFVLVGESPRRVTGILTRTALLRHLYEAQETRVAPAAGEDAVEEDVSALLERRLPTTSAALLRRLGELADASGVQAHLVGGVVRDLLLRRETRDLDVVVEGDACELARRLAEDTGGRVRMHEAFQTAALVLPSGVRVDLATARTEHYARPAALPQVSRGGLRQDLFRRDFTVNALAVRLNRPAFGKLLDFFGGRKDLREGKIRVLHGLSFIEDPTRAFRAVRFATQLGFKISRETAHLIRVATQERVFERLTPLRLRREVSQLLGGRKAAEAVKALVEFQLLGAIHPALRPTRRTYARLERADEILSWYRLLYRKEAAEDWTVTLGVLAESLDAGAREALLERLRPGRKAAKVLREAPDAVHGILSRLTVRGATPSSIHRACRSESTEILLLAMTLTRREDVRRRLADYLSRLRDVRPDVRGTDLLQAGVPEGPQVAEGLDAALRAKLDGSAADVAAQLAAALEALRRA